MWLFREHRGALKDAMKTCKSYNSLLEVIEAAAQKATYRKGVTNEIQIFLYSAGDERIGWSPVYMVCGKNEVIGFCTERK